MSPPYRDPYSDSNGLGSNETNLAFGETSRTNVRCVPSPYTRTPASSDATAGAADSQMSPGYIQQVPGSPPAGHDGAQPMQQGIRGSRTESRSLSYSDVQAAEEEIVDLRKKDVQAFKAKVAELLHEKDREPHTSFDSASGNTFLASRAHKDELVNVVAHIRDLERTIASLRRGMQPGQYQSEHEGSSNRDDHLIENLDAAQYQEGWKSELKRWKRVKNRYGSYEVYDESEKIEDIRKRERGLLRGGYILNVYDEFDGEENKTDVKLEINSTPLLELLRSVITYYPGDELEVLRGKDDTVVFDDPYMILYTCRTELEQALLSNDYSVEAKSHLKVLLDFMKSENPKRSAKLTEIEAGKCEKIYHKDLWLLYPPNTPVYVNTGRTNRQIVVYSRDAPGPLPKGLGKALTLQCWDVEFEHKEFTRDFIQWRIEPYVGEKNVTNLELVPARYMPNEPELRKRLIARGQRYCDLKRTAILQDYYGNEFPRVYTDEPIRVVVDEDTYWQKNPDMSKFKLPNQSQEYGFPDKEADLVDENNQPREDTLVRCYPELGVYSLRDKKWALVKVDDLKPVNFREKAFKRLVIKTEYKQMIKAMVQAYMRQQPGFSDLVTGKGRGLTILLHGPPGTGKTLTAECIAEKHQCPLFTISCGDLGTEPEELEDNIKEVFQYAVSWKAILLLDEADIFLQERDIHDLKRNALVSVFLRELEYFDGILFLTTNRPGDIDEAFVSRIHVSLSLKRLEPPEQRKIWTLFIKDLSMPEREKDALLKHVTDKKFGNDRLNGRQIRNCVRTALTLAQVKDETVKADHLEQVLKIGREYMDYVKDLNKMDGEEYAIQMGRRAAQQ